MPDSFTEGTEVRLKDGAAVGLYVVGDRLGRDEGLIVGALFDGFTDGDADGLTDGCDDGFALGAKVGKRLLGIRVGYLLGTLVGDFVDTIKGTAAVEIRNAGVGLLASADLSLISSTTEDKPLKTFVYE